ncbi:MAG: hypothetical protein MJZ11_09955 [Lachnospiraceae bacterium]|nr:hypothetical protein [Lachnospiraceae bacterium]
MRVNVQNILFPTEAKLEDNLARQMFFKGNGGYYDREYGMLSIGECNVFDFATYFNAISYAKWKKYTEFDDMKLTLDIEGKGIIKIIGYHFNNYNVSERDELNTYRYENDERGKVVIDIPNNFNTIVGFEILSDSRTVIYGGYYIANFKDELFRNVELCLATTTCKKEEYIKRNILVLKDNIFDSSTSIEDEEIFDIDNHFKKHFYVHVIDNGRTLDTSELSSCHIQVHPNKNVGGSGGFARGMIESMEQSPKATHVLLMDDDVLILPESIRKTFILLSFIKEEYKESFISGAMFLMDQMQCQHEDIGTLTKDAVFLSLKGRLFMDIRDHVLINEGDFYNTDYKYCAWWYCCIPVGVIEKHGLPLPLFIRGDDVEYGMRCKPDIISMNGICVWHLGFENKFNPAMDWYQQSRNMLIDKAVGSFPEDVNVIKYVQNAYRHEIRRFNYNGARTVLKALEDFLKGPEFIEEDLGEKILIQNNKLNEVYKPLNEYEDYEFDLRKVGGNPGYSRLKRYWYGITNNGQRFCMDVKKSMEPELIMFNSDYQPGKYLGRNVLYAVNPWMKTAAIRRKNISEYKKINRKWRNTIRKYNREYVSLCSEYRLHMEKLVSIDFWKKYLGI